MHVAFKYVFKYAQRFTCLLYFSPDYYVLMCLEYFSMYLSQLKL